MSVSLKGFEEFSLPYLDDMIGFSNTWEEHLQHIDIVLRTIADVKLKVKLSKCKFAQKTVKYLGHIVGEGRSTPVKEKF